MDNQPFHIENIEVEVGRRNVKKLSLTFCPPRRFVVNVPPRYCRLDVEKILHASYAWMRSCLSKAQCAEPEGAFEFDGKPIPVTYKAMKNLRLKVAVDGSLSLSAPTGISREAILLFLERNADSIRKMLAKSRQRQAENEAGLCGFRDGDSFTLLGKVYRLQVEEYAEGQRPQPSISLDGATQTARLVCPAAYAPEERRRLVMQYAGQRLQRLLEGRLAHWTEQMKLRRKPELYISLMRSRWGVCYPDKCRVGFSLLLAHYPPEVIEAVVVHELCHLTYSGHGRPFYNLLLSHLPDYRTRYKALKERVKYRIC